MEINPEQLTETITAFIREYMDRLERDGVILGLSGGVDSSVVAALCARAVGPEKTLALLMPEKDSMNEHMDDIQALLYMLKIECRTADIKGTSKNWGSTAFSLWTPLYPTGSGLEWWTSFRNTTKKGTESHSSTGHLYGDGRDLPKRR